MRYPEGYEEAVARLVKDAHSDQYRSRNTPTLREKHILSRKVISRATVGAAAVALYFLMNPRTRGVLFTFTQLILPEQRAVATTPAMDFASRRAYQIAQRESTMQHNTGVVIRPLPTPSIP